MTLTLDVTTEVESQLLRAARLKGLDAKSFVLALLRDYLISQATSIAERSESGLLEEINQGFPAEHWQRHEELAAKHRAETLTAEEHTEMLAHLFQESSSADGTCGLSAAYSQAH